MKKKLLEIFNDYKQEFYKYFQIFKLVIKKRYQKIKKQFLMQKNRKRNIAILVALIIVNILFINLFISNAYYHDNSSLTLIHSKVGNMYINEYDYTLLVYLEDTGGGKGNGKYHLAPTIPLIGYTYGGYNCQNNSTLLYDDVAKTTSVTMSEKEVCSIYFDIVGNVDISIDVMLEDGIETNNYNISNNIPYYGYEYDHYECENSNTLEYDSNKHVAKVATNKKEYCSIYFKKTKADINLNLFVEESYNSNNYINRENIPSNVSYIINNEKTKCVNNSNENINNTITYFDGYINLETANISYCDVYLDVENE